MRYKKRFYMTVFGIAGCCALLLTGFGLRDSIHDIVDIQFGQIYKYNLSVYLKSGADLDGGVLAPVLRDETRIAEYAVLHFEACTVSLGGKEERASLYVPENTAQLKQMYALRERKSGTDIPFEDSSLILTEKLCEKLGVGVGDSVLIRSADGAGAQFTVTGVMENYVMAYAFISESAYINAFGEQPDPQLVLAKTADESQTGRDALSQALLESDDVLLLQYTETIRESFSNTVKNIDYIVMVLIFSAGLLAVIVLYNLTNINICERKRELATIKVLGFHEKEVAAYIYRETTILCLVGIAFGFVFGVWLHAFVVRTAEVDAVMFGRRIYLHSFLYAAAVTAGFTALVDAVMLLKLKAIDMVESMKANE